MQLTMSDQGQLGLIFTWSWDLRGDHGHRVLVLALSRSASTDIDLGRAIRSQLNIRLSAIGAVRALEI